jgi:hypothetical protein
MARLTNTQLQTIKDEINNDPVGIGYKNGEEWKTSVEIEGLFAAINRTVGETQIRCDDILNAIDASEYANFTENQKQRLDVFLNGGYFIIERAIVKVRQLINFVYSDKPITRDALIALTYKTVSRAEELGLPTIRFFHIEQAALLP